MIRKFSEAQVAAVRSNKGGRSPQLTEYEKAIRNLRVNEMGGIELGESDKRQTIKNRVASAAKNVGATIEWIPTNPTALAFKVITAASA